MGFVGVKGAVEKSVEIDGSGVSCACAEEDSSGILLTDIETLLLLHTVSVVARTTLTWPSRLTGSPVALEIVLRSDPVDMSPVFSCVVPVEAVP